MSYSVNSLKEAHIGDHNREQYRVLRWILGV